MIINRLSKLANNFVMKLRLGQLCTELSVVFFGLFFAHLDSQKTIFRIMYLTVPISLIYISIQVFIFRILIKKRKHKILNKSNRHL